MNLQKRIEKLERTMSRSRGVACTVLHLEGDTHAYCGGQLYARQGDEDRDAFVERVKATHTVAARQTATPTPFFCSELDALL